MRMSCIPNGHDFVDSRRLYVLPRWQDQNAGKAALYFDRIIVLIFCFYGSLSHLNWPFLRFTPPVHRKIATTDHVPQWRFPYIVGFVNNRYPYGGNR